MAILERISLLMKKGDEMTLSELIDEGVICFLDAGSRDAAIQQLINDLADSGKITDRNVFFDAIVKREQIVSTGIGMGVAVPHAKLPIFDHFFLSIGIQRAKNGISWDALDETPVRLILMIGGPTDQQTDYLKILSRLTSAIKDEDRRKHLLNAKTKEEVAALFEGC